MKCGPCAGGSLRLGLVSITVRPMAGKGKRMNMFSEFAKAKKAYGRSSPVVRAQIGEVVEPLLRIIEALITERQARIDARMGAEHG